MAMLRNEKDVAGEGFLEDGYLPWRDKEGPPINEDFRVDPFEAETGIWNMLPEQYRGAAVGRAIAGELSWALARLPA